LRDLLRPWPFYLFTPRADRAAKLFAPLVGGLQDDFATDSMNENLPLVFWKADSFRKTHRLASAVMKDLRFGYHGWSIDECIYRGKSLLACTERPEAGVIRLSSPWMHQTIAGERFTTFGGELTATRRFQPQCSGAKRDSGGPTDSC